MLDTEIIYNEKYPINIGLDSVTFSKIERNLAQKTFQNEARAPIARVIAISIGHNL